MQELRVFVVEAKEAMKVITPDALSLIDKWDVECGVAEKFIELAEKAGTVHSIGEFMRNFNLCKLNLTCDHLMYITDKY